MTDKKGISIDKIDKNIDKILKNFHRNRLQLFILLFVSYIGYYFCRVNLLAAMPALEENFKFTNTQTGLILSGYFVVYTVGKLVNGLLGDRIGGKVLLLVGIGGSVICNVIFGFGQELGFFIAVWSINAYFQCMGWLAMVSLMSHWYTSKECGRAMGIISLSYLVGDFLARSSAGLLLGREGANWSDLFWVHAAIFAAIGILALLFVKPFPEKIGLPDIDSYTSYVEPESQSSSVKTSSENKLGSKPESTKWLIIMLTNRWFWMVCLVYLGLSIMRYIFWSWSIVYLKNSGLSISSAVIFSAVFPLLGAFGAIFAGWISDRMQARRGPVLAMMTSCMVLFVFIFGKIPSNQPILLVITLGFLGFTLIGPYSLIAGAMAIDFGSKHTAAAAAGVIDAVGAIGAIFSGAGMGYLIDRYGWDGAFMIVSAIALCTAILCFTMWKLRPLRETEKL